MRRADRGNPISVGNQFVFSGLRCLYRHPIADSMELSHRVAGINTLGSRRGDGFAGNGLLGSLRVSGGDLEGVEENAGTFVIHLVVGDRIHDLADGELNGSAVLERRELERLKGAGGAGGTLPEAGVEVTEGLAAQGGGTVVRARPPIGTAGYDDPSRITVKSVTLMSTASSAVRRRACMLKVTGKGGSGGYGGTPTVTGL